MKEACIKNLGVIQYFNLLFSLQPRQGGQKMAATILEAEGQLIYSAIIGGDREGEETADMAELMEVIRTHLDTAEQCGRKLGIMIFHV